MEKKPRVLFILTLPPPVHGSAVVSKYIKDSKIINDKYECVFVNLSTSRNLGEIGNNSPIKIWRFLMALLKQLWMLIIHRYDLCYLAITCHGTGFLKDMPHVLLCKIFCNKIVIHQHNKGMSKDIDRWPYRWLLPLCYKNADVILLSWLLYEDIEKTVPKDKVYICPNGIPTVYKEYKERNNPIPRILFLSNLLSSKGVFVLLDSLKILHDKSVPFVCVFAGGETKEITEEKILDEINKRGLNILVTYHGPIYGAAKELMFEQTDIFVFPSFYENETFGLVNLEAMTHHIPIISTNEGGIPDVVVDGENGLICEKRNAISLADCIEKLIKDKELREKMGKAGFERYQKYYTLDIFERNFLHILDDVIC